jgi:hypothetical protein
MNSSRYFALTDREGNFMKSLAMNRVHRVLALAVAASLAGLAGCGDSKPSESPDAPGGDIDAGMPDAGTPDSRMPDATLPPDGTPNGPMASVRIMNASQSGSIDIYLFDQTTPIFTAVGYGTTSPQIQLPAGSYQFDIRPAGGPITRSASFTSAPIAVTADASTTLFATGTYDSQADSSRFHLTGLPDAFAPAATGKTRIRFVNAMYSSATLALDLGDDGSLDVAALDRFVASDAAGVEVAAGSELSISVVGIDAAHTPVGTFIVPAASLVDGANVYVVLAGLGTLAPRDPRGAAVVVLQPPGAADALIVHPNPIVYLLTVSADAGSLDGYIGTSKLFGGLGFGKIGQHIVRPTATGYTLDLRATGAAPTSTPIAALPTGELAAGQQYLAIVSGLVSPNSLALRVYRDDITIANDFGRVRAINASLGAGSVDFGRFTTGGSFLWNDIPSFAAIAPGDSSPAAGSTIVNAASLPQSLNPGVRLSSDISKELHFGNVGLLNGFDRFYGVFAGAWAPIGAQVAPSYVIVKTAGATPWTTTVLALTPTSIAVTPDTANLVVGTTQQLVATASFGNDTTSIVTATATWTSTGTLIAPVTNTGARGLVSAIAPGSATIKATLAGASDSAAITVIAAQAPSVSATQPADAAIGVAATAPIAVTFSLPIAPASLTTQTTTGTCAATLQLSADNFATCVGFSAAAPALDATGMIATAVPAAALTAQTYKLRVLGTVTSTAGAPIGATFTQATGFTVAAGVCTAGLVISQVYGGGSANGGVYRNDFIELHNNGAVAVDLGGFVLQSGIATGSTWTAQQLPSVMVPAGGYFLIQEAGGSSTTQLELPTPDYVPTAGLLSISGTVGKIALTSAATGFIVACPLTTVPSSIFDLVGYGTGNCFEGTVMSALTNATAAARNDGGCSDTNVNSADFAVAAPAPRNSGTARHVCACTH